MIKRVTKINTLKMVILFAMSFGSVGFSQTVEIKPSSIIPIEYKTPSGQVHPLEPSGAKFIHGELWFVSDKPSDNALYQVDAQGHVDIALDFKGLQEEYVQKISKDFDLEGLANCGSTYYVVNERVRHVLKIQPALKLFSKLDIEFPKEAFEGSSNAGFEGVAVDCENQIMYVAKEREPRLIFKINLETLLIEETFNLPEPAAHVVRNTAGKSFEIKADYSDLCFYRGLLYVLERNASRIAVIDPERDSKKVIRYLDYASFQDTDFNSPNGFYHTEEAYGLAEGLGIKGDEIILLFDNNGKPVSESTKDRLTWAKEKPRAPVMVTFKINP